MIGEESCIVEAKDESITDVRTEIACITDGVHLGHLFDDGPRGPGNTGLRYCMNSLAMNFIPKERLSEA